jgi:putative DNA primase/helicase
MSETRKKVTSKEIIHTLQHLGYKFRLNVLTDRIEVNGEPITDIHLAVIRTELKDRGIGNTRQVEDAVIVEASKHEYHPIKEYLQSLLGWDGEPYIAKLAGYFTDVDGVFQMLIEKWMIGAVAKIFTGGEAQNPMLVLDGRQNLGKSQFTWWLCPNGLRRNHFFEGAINPDNKDDHIKLMNIWIWEAMELGMTLRRADREALKAFITLRQVTTRKPYGREPIIKPAMSSFIGTINNEGGFLTDPTGHRRFRPCHLLKIDWDYAVDMYQGDIWAEAYAKYLMGDSYKLDQHETGLMIPIRERYQLIDPMEELLQRYFHITPMDTGLWMSSTEILLHLESSMVLHNAVTRGNTMALAVAANKLGLKKVKRNNMNGYTGIRTKP